MGRIILPGDRRAAVGGEGDPCDVVGGLRRMNGSAREVEGQLVGQVGDP
jgi:hypothetical protein